MNGIRKGVLVVGVLLGLSLAQGCGSWMKCLGSGTCSKSIENATTAQLFISAVNSSLESFKSVMADLGLSDAQQSSVIDGVQAKAQELTSQLGLADDSSYSGTVLENLTAMFNDLTEYAVTKITEVAPSLDESKIANAVASFTNELLAYSGEVNILASLPTEEQAELPVDSDGRLDVHETLGSTVTQAAVGSVIAARPSIKPEDMMARMDHFERKPGARPQAPAQVREYQPTDAQREVGRSRVQGDLCQGKPANMGAGGGRSPNSSADGRVPLPMRGCQGVAIDRDLTFCLTAPQSAFKVCTKNVYGIGGTKNSIKYWIDGAEQVFSGFTAGVTYDCSVPTARKELAKLLATEIKTKKANCQAFVPPTSGSSPSAPPTSGPLPPNPPGSGSSPSSPPSGAPSMPPQ